ncbi:potassium transporter [Fulvivirga sp. 29W222]|uniref:Potassium transporter n=1 Tax=Fulvivirga marina TaxID=2494733 RepID=A0A937FTT3_9BACT|nr:ion channel [Fulvivirga marina]MBL6445614.1 potassium transporter [Fulvivirga marina]
MANSKQTRDPGVGTQYTINSKRIINQDGSFNVIRSGLRVSTRDTYQLMIKMSWSRFFLVVFTFLLVVNAVFALVYTLMGVDQLGGLRGGHFYVRFLEAYYFSFQTFTTVGYGGVHPIGHWANIVASFEAVVGWMCFAIITGMLYGRFSKPSARLMYSKKALIAPYKDGLNSLQFRIANMRNSNLMEMEATVMLVTVERHKDGKSILKRSYINLDLERNSILYFPLNWTVVHVIDEKSPLANKTKEEMEAMDAEILIMIKGFDDTFSQVVHSRYSYKCDEVFWGGKFASVYETQPSGDTLMDFTKMNDFTDVELN